MLLLALGDSSQCCCCVYILMQCCRCQSLKRLNPIVSVVWEVLAVMFVLMHCFCCCFFLVWASFVMCHLVHVLPYFPCQFLNVMLYHAVSRVCYIKLSFLRRSRCLIMFFLSASPVPITQPWHAPACPSARLCVTCLPQPADPVAFHAQVVSQFSCGSFRPSWKRPEPSAWHQRPPSPAVDPVGATRELDLSPFKVGAAGHGRSSSGGSRAHVIIPAQW